MKVRCPDCGGKLIAICYGYPTYETFEKAQRGEVFIGGCMRMEFVYYCNRCGVSYSEDLSLSKSDENVFYHGEG